MNGIVSLLPEPYYSQVETIWSELEEAVGISGVRITPYPHFSWQIGEEYDEQQLSTALAALAAQIRPFTIRTTGLGLFTGERPVIFLPVIQSAALVSIHQMVWDALLSTGSGLSDYYAPDQWVPHITLAFADVTNANIGRIMQQFAFRDFNWEMVVDNFAYVCQPPGKVAEKRFEIHIG